MPAPGQQHAAAATFNPYDPEAPRISLYTAQEIATLQSRLEKQLGPEYISNRSGPGGNKVFYVSGEKCINLANEVFGFNGWSSSIREIQVDFADEVAAGKYNVGLSVIVRVTIRDGMFHEDIGYGHIENCKGKAAAFEKAKKEGTTDALKRALRNFGKVLGLCVYDKDYLNKVSKLKVEPTRWDPANLHRHADFAPSKPEPKNESKNESVAIKSEPAKVTPVTSLSPVAEFDDEFGTADFDEADFSVAIGDHPDEVVLDAADSANPLPNPTNLDQLRQNAPRLLPNGKAQNSNSYPVNGATNANFSRNNAQQQQPMPNMPISNPNALRPQQVQNPQAAVAQGRQNGPNTQNGQQINGNQQFGNGTLVAANPQNVSNQPNKLGLPSAQAPQRNSNVASVPPRTSETDAFAAKADPSRSQSNGPEPPVGFYTARAAEKVQQGKNLGPDTVAFNPHRESPSIRKTAGVDHSASKPVPREIIKGPVPAHPQGNPKTNFVNPHLDQARKIGMPASVGSPLQNRGSYRPPQMLKRPADGQPLQNERPPLNDVTANSVNASVDNAGDFKRPKIEPRQVQTRSTDVG